MQAHYNAYTSGGGKGGTNLKGSAKEIHKSILQVLQDKQGHRFVQTDAIHVYVEG